MVGRTNAFEDFEFGYNGQMKTDEIYGKGNLNTALFWEYDSRIERRWNVDPKPNPSWSSYATFANNPILNRDVLGDSIKSTSNFAGPKEKDFSNKVFKNAWSGKDDPKRNCDMCCLNALASNLSAMYGISEKKIDKGGTMVTAMKAVKKAGFLGDKVVVQPTLDGKTLNSSNSREDFQSEGASTNVVNNLTAQMEGHKGAFAFAVALAYGYHSTIIMAYNDGQRIVDNEGNTQTASADNPMFVFIEDAGGARVFNSADLESKLMEFYMGARAFYSGERGVGGVSVENKDAKNMGAIIYNLEAQKAN
jgi:hypothetical protein